jgi:hypothetical protein
MGPFGAHALDTGQVHSLGVIARRRHVAKAVLPRGRVRSAELGVGDEECGEDVLVLRSNRQIQIHSGVLTRLPDDVAKVLLDVPPLPKTP